MCEQSLWKYVLTKVILWKQRMHQITETRVSNIEYKRMNTVGVTDYTN